VSEKTKIPMEQYHATIARYKGVPEREYTNSKRHVYFSRPLRKWIIARPKGKKHMELEFTPDCPCSYDH
jgi:hypothetical protein